MVIDADVNTEYDKPFISNLFSLKRKQEVANSYVKRCKVDESGTLDNHLRQQF